MFKKPSISKIILIVWIIFSVLYVAWGEWSRFKMVVMQRSYQQGVADAVAQVIDQAKTCKAFPVNIGENKATLVSVDCLKQAEQPKNEGTK